jgi:hypothetical protein
VCDRCSALWRLKKPPRSTARDHRCETMRAIPAAPRGSLAHPVGPSHGDEVGRFAAWASRRLSVERCSETSRHDIQRCLPERE